MMSVTREQIEAIVQCSALDKGDTRELIAEWQPEITDEEFEAMWKKGRTSRVTVH